MVLSIKIDHNIFRSIFGTEYSIGISLHVGAFKKDMQQNSSIELILNSVPHDHSNAYLPDI